MALVSVVVVAVGFFLVAMLLAFPFFNKNFVAAKDVDYAKENQLKFTHSVMDWSRRSKISCVETFSLFRLGRPV